ncbi:Inhibitor of growth protein 5 [Intoshia linei]|uniref:Inhibitor of growth protein n=1 Tax=Intoshia linei TaxID=1819745 RepID=A0A177B4W5_9BILA|nr:Inhibitor of growth protein 5 [Intoshia linei]
MGSKLSPLYLDSCFDVLNEIPVQLKQYLNDLTNLNKTYVNGLNEIDNVWEDYIKSKKNKSTSNLMKTRNSIKSSAEKLIKISKKKVKISDFSYTLIDNQINKLDKDLLRFENQLKDDKILFRMLNAENLDKYQQTLFNKENNKSHNYSLTDAEASRLPLLLMSCSETIDMPIDENEPRYCYCNKVSYGLMIGCDNEECMLEWFHYECAGIKTQPKGKWYCNNCLLKN